MDNSIHEDKSQHHINSMLMRESLIDERILANTEDAQTTPTVRMLPKVHVLKIGASSIVDKGRVATYPVVEVVGKLLEKEKIIIGAGGGARSRHIFSIGLDLGLPAGVLAQLSVVDGLGNGHILGTLLAPYGVVAIPPEIFGHLLPLFIHSAPGVIYNGVPPYSLWEHPPSVGRVPPHRSDAGCVILSECFGCKTMTLVKDVDGLYDKDPKQHSDAQFIDEINVYELEKKNLETLPFDRVLIDIMKHTRLTKRFQVINGLKPELIAAALNGEHVGTIIHNE